MNQTPAHSATPQSAAAKPPGKIWDGIAWAGTLILGYFLIQAVMDSRDWPAAMDTQILNYMAWLMGEGQMPYRDIFDVNMPGTYLLHWAIVNFVGNDPLVWRFFDLVWLGVTCGAILLFCKRQGWLTGVFTALLFALFHLDQGIAGAGERDFLLVLPLILSAHFTANCAEGKHALVSAFIAGLVLGLAFWIKPYVAALFILYFLYAKIASRSVFVSLLMLLGFVLPVAAGFGGLYWFGLLLPWWEMVTQYAIPIYTTIAPENFLALAKEAIFSPVMILIPFLLLSTPFTPRYFVGLMGLAYGLLHYFMQHKGFEHHAAPFVAMLTIFVCYRLGSNLKAPKTAPRVIAAIAVLLTVYFASPFIRFAAEPADKNYISPASDIVKALRPLLAPGDVIQPLDVRQGGVLEALHQLRVKPATPYLYDFPFYATQGAGHVAWMEDTFIQNLRQNPPKAMVMSPDSWPYPEKGFARLEGFPGLKTLLDERYALAVNDSRFRIYIRN